MRGCLKTPSKARYLRSKVFQNAHILLVCSASETLSALISDLIQRFQIASEGRNFLLFFFLVVTVFSFPTPRGEACPFPLATTVITVKGYRLVVELAVTPQTRVCGLSRRAVLDKDHGMLFVYPDAGMRTYWMKDTWIPLSIAFLDDVGKIINIETMAPDQTEIKYRSRRPAVYVLEVNQGWFHRHHINAGDRVGVDRRTNAGGRR
jgi:uncharacterized protein